MEKWERRETYRTFLSYDLPYLVIGANISIGSAFDRLKAASRSPFLGTVYAVCRAANEVQAFRLRIRDKVVVEHDAVHPSFTVPGGEEAFAVRKVGYDVNFNQFYQAAAAAESETFAPEIDQMGSDHWIFASCMPWIQFTHVLQPVSPVTASIPRLIWGKAFEDHGRWLLPMSVQVHHALMDGIHVARFLERMEELFASSETFA
jgi:chloramphenicol O-acetyltransferase type A